MNVQASLLQVQKLQSKMAALHPESIAGLQGIVSEILQILPGILTEIQTVLNAVGASGLSKPSVPVNPPSA